MIGPRMLTFIYHLEAEEHIRAVRAWMEIRPVPRLLARAPLVLGAAALGLLAWVATAPAGERGRLLWEYGPLLLLPALILMIYRWLLRGGVMRGLMEELPHVDEPVTVTLSDESFHLASRWERDTRPWDTIERVVETPEFLLFVISRDCAHYLPKQAIKTADDWDAVRDIIRTQAGERAQLMDTPFVRSATVTPIYQ